MMKRGKASASGACPLRARRAAVAEQRRLVDAFTRAGVAERVYHKEMFFTAEALSGVPSSSRLCFQICVRPRQLAYAASLASVQRMLLQARTVLQAVCAAVKVQLQMSGG